MTQAEQVKAMVGFRGVDVLSREADRNCQEMRYIRRLDRVEFRFADGSQITIVAGRKVSVK